MKRKDCAYCIDLDEQGALCDHPLRWDCGEPVEARCSSRCADYERRMSVTETLSRIHDLESKLAESEKYRARYADMLIPIMAENAKLREQGARLFDKTLELGTENEKLRELVRAAWRCIHTGASCSDCRLIAGGCTLQTAMRELGVEIDG